MHIALIVAGVYAGLCVLTYVCLLPLLRVSRRSDEALLEQGRFVRAPSVTPPPAPRSRRTPAGASSWPTRRCRSTGSRSTARACSGPRRPASP